MQSYHPLTNSSLSPQRGVLSQSSQNPQNQIQSPTSISTPLDDFLSLPKKESSMKIVNSHASSSLQESIEISPANNGGKKIVHLKQEEAPSLTAPILVNPSLNGVSKRNAADKLSLPPHIFRITRRSINGEDQTPLSKRTVQGLIPPYKMQKPNNENSIAKTKKMKTEELHLSKEQKASLAQNRGVQKQRKKVEIQKEGPGYNPDKCQKCGQSGSSLQKYEVVGQEV